MYIIFFVVSCEVISTKKSEPLSRQYFEPSWHPIMPNINDISYFILVFFYYSHKSILLDKNSGSLSSGISADSRSRYWWLCGNHQILVDVLLTFSQKLSVFLFNLFLHTNCQSPLSILTRERKVYACICLFGTSQNIKHSSLPSCMISIAVYSLPQGFHHFLIIEFSTFSSSCIFFF